MPTSTPITAEASSSVRYDPLTLTEIFILINKFVQRFWKNKPAVIGSFIGVALIVCGVIAIFIFLFFKRRNVRRQLQPHDNKNKGSLGTYTGLATVPSRPPSRTTSNPFSIHEVPRSPLEMTQDSVIVASLRHVPETPTKPRTSSDKNWESNKNRKSEDSFYCQGQDEELPHSLHDSRSKHNNPL